MVRLRPAGSVLQGQVTFLEEQAQKIEDELAQQLAILEENNIGMTEPLVDDEGCPRTDVDAYRIRNVRQKVVSLQNDHSSVINKIRTGLVEINPDLRSPLSTSEGLSINALGAACHTGESSTDCGKLKEEKIAVNEGTRAFAIIDTVEPESPAEKAGLMPNDQLLQFGAITHLNFYDLSQIQCAVSQAIGENILMKVRRQRQLLNLVIAPRPWSQPGLLGCRMKKL